jgi:hypothetical protein
MGYIVDDYLAIRRRAEQIRIMEKENQYCKFVLPLDDEAGPWAWGWIQQHYSRIEPMSRFGDRSRQACDFMPCPFGLRPFLDWLNRSTLFEISKVADHSFLRAYSLEDRINNTKILLCRLYVLNLIDHSLLCVNY